MTEQKKTVSNSAIWSYALTQSLQTFTIMTPYAYGTLFMTTYLGINMATMGTILVIAKFVDFIICMSSGAIIESANFKKGKYVPIMELFRWVVAIGAVGQMTDLNFLPYGVKFTVVAASYICMHGSMNFLQTANYGLMAVMAGGNYTDRIAIAQKNSQISAAVGILRSFGTVPLITFVGKVMNSPAKGYTVVTIAFAVVYIACTFWFASNLKGKEAPRDPNAPKRIVKLKDMIEALTGNDQLIVYLIWQTISQLGTQIMTLIGIYYWTLVMGGYTTWYSIGMGLTTCSGFVFSLFVPKIGVKLGKLKSLFIAQYAGWVAHVLRFFLGLKSYYWMTVIGIASSAVMYLQMGFGANYVLDIGEYGYYKTGKDYRAVVTAFSSVPMKLSSVIAGAVGPYFLSFIGFDKFNEANMAGTLDKTSAEFIKFQKTYMAAYCFTPLIGSVLGFLIFKKGYKITDDKAVFYAKENAAKAAQAAAAKAQA
ncbi:MAG: hypothetical protein GX061_05610 [Eubacteriaceae bacterium]|nr:hypothetical protein [Eubacteriaceae bacterium]